MGTGPDCQVYVNGHQTLFIIIPGGIPSTACTYPENHRACNKRRSWESFGARVFPSRRIIVSKIRQRRNGWGGWESQSDRTKIGPGRNGAPTWGTEMRSDPEGVSCFCLVNDLVHGIKKLAPPNEFAWLSESEHLVSSCACVEETCLEEGIWIEEVVLITDIVHW